MRVKHFSAILLIIGCSALLSGCLASALTGQAVTNELTGPPGSGSYTTTADTLTIFQDVQSALRKIGTVQSANRETGDIVGFDAQRHYVYVAKIRPSSGSSGAVLDLKVTLIAGSLTVGRVKTVDVMNAFVDQLDSDLGDKSLVPVKAQN